jgi:RHS repeat-associated protein
MCCPLIKSWKKLQSAPYFGVFLCKKNAYRETLADFDLSGKELDAETGFCYYGARYLNPKTSMWISADPAVSDYIPKAPVDDEAKKHNGNLPGMGGVFNYVNFHVYHYAGNNPVKFIDPNGMWQDNEDGTFTAEKGDSLWGLYGADWQEKSGYTGDPTKLQPGEVVGKLKETTVTANGSGNGIFASAIIGGSGAEIDKSWYEMQFKIQETGETFSAKYTTTAVEGEGFKLGAGIYTLTIDATGKFKGKPPTQNQIMDSFAGEAISLGFSFLWFGVNGSETENWTVNTGTFGISVGIPGSGGAEKSHTQRLQ